MKETDFWGCYSGSWRNEIVPDAFQHPAKFARGLIKRIYEHAIEQGYFKPGMKIFDPFGGVALGALDAMRHGLNWYGLELEVKFCDLGQGHDCPGFSKEDWKRFHHRIKRCNWRLKEAHLCPECVKEMSQDPLGRWIPTKEGHHFQGNIEYWHEKYGGKFRNWGTAVLQQGDSRFLSRYLFGDGIVGSPPFSVGETRDRHPASDGEVSDAMTRAYTKDRQGVDSANLAGLDGIFSSPPYVDSINTEGNGIDWDKAGRPDRTQESDARKNPMSTGKMKYGDDTANLGAMPAGVVTSPPYANMMEGGDGPGIRHDEKEHKGDNAFKNSSDSDYGRTPGQMSVMGSPPFEDSLDRGTVDKDARIQHARNNDIDNAEFISPIDMERVGKRNQEYGSSDHNIGNETGETFWSAARMIVSECYTILAPGSHTIWVTKRFVRDKKIVDFSQMWFDLCVSCGFEPVEWIRAHLTEDKGNAVTLLDVDTAATMTLLDGTVKEFEDVQVLEQGKKVRLQGRKVKSAEVKRVSFFRRLHEAKYPELSINWEDILVLKKPPHV